MSFWKQYQSLCESIGKSPNAVADELEFSNATCTKWKNGATPQGKSLAKIAEYFDVTVDYLIGDNLKKYKAIEIPQEVREKIIGGVINTALEHGQKVEVISVKTTVKEWFEILSKLSDDNLIKLKEYAELLLLQQAQASQK